MVGDGAPELVPAAETGLAHHPRHERRRPGGVPSRSGAARPVPRIVLSLHDPGTFGRDGPVPGDRGRDARRFLGAEPRSAPPAAPRVRRGATAVLPAVSGRNLVVDVRPVHDPKPEEAPLLCGHVDDAPPCVFNGQGTARQRLDGHPARCAPHVRGGRHDVEHVGRQPLETGLLGSSTRCGGERDQHGGERQDKNSHASFFGSSDKARR